MLLKKIAAGGFSATSSAFFFICFANKTTLNWLTRQVAQNQNKPELNILINRTGFFCCRCHGTRHIG